MKIRTILSSNGGKSQVILEMSPGDMSFLRCQVRQLNIWEASERWLEADLTDKQNVRLVFIKERAVFSRNENVC